MLNPGWPHAALAAVSLITLGVVAQGCARGLPAPVPETVEPDRGWGGQVHTVDITGRNFFPLVLADAASAEGDTVDDSFRIELLDPDSGSAIASFRRVSLFVDEASGERRLRGDIPAGLEVGAYDVRVTGPDGGAGTAEDAYTVTSTPVEQLSMSVRERGPFTPGETAVLDLQLLGRDGVKEYAELPIDVVVQRLDGFPLVGSIRSDLQGSVDTGLLGELALSGRTNLDGAATVWLTLDEPGDVTIRASIPDSDVAVPDETRALSWEPGGEYTYELLVPDEPQLIAGQTLTATLILRDKVSGAVVQTPPEPITGLLYDQCGDITPSRIVSLAGQREQVVQLRTATADRSVQGGCEEQRLVLEVDGQRVRSAEISVAPSALSRLSVQTLQSTVQAGSPLRALVYPADEFGNIVPAELEPSRIDLVDNVGGVRATGCDPIDGGAFCEVEPTVAGSFVRLTASDVSTGLVGTSPSFVVVAGPAASFDVAVDPDDLASGIAAGGPFGVVLRVFDAYGNDADTSAVDAQTFVVTDLDLDEAECEFRGPGERGEVRYDCTLYTAGSAAMEASGLGTSAVSPRFSVVNGPVAEIDVELSESSVRAGESVAIVLEAYDAFRNPLIERSGNLVDLRSELGGLDTSSLELDSVGRASGTVRFTTAGIEEVVASFNGTAYGRSDTIEVLPGAAVGLDVRADEPWAFRGDEVEVQVTAVDRYGNRTTTSDGATVTSANGLFTGSSLSLVGGVGTVGVTFTGTSVGEEIVATSDSGLTGALSDFPVAEACGSTGPTLSLSFDGGTSPIACIEQGEADITGDFSGSTDRLGGAPSVHALWIEGAGRGVSSSSPSIDIVARDTGRLALRGFVMDRWECGREVSRDAWIGEDDGQPTGPIDPILGSTSLSTGTGSTSIRLSRLTTCDGSTAAGGTVKLRTDIGDITGVSTSGSGLELTLDSTGSASATLDLTAADSDGSGTVHTWIEGGSALGSAGFTALGDSRPPRVVDQDVLGYTDVDTDHVVLTFSEPIDTRSVSTSAFSIRGPTTAVIDAVDVSDDGLQVTVWFDEDIDMSAGAFELTAFDDLTDDAGNALDGDWTGSASDYIAEFGKVSAVVPDMSSCSFASTTFRPDGDAGSGIEVEIISVTARATRTPDVIVLDVTDRSGDRVVTDRIRSTFGTTTVEWDGRDASGHVVADGRYTITLTGYNADGTAGTPCSDTVTVDNERGY